MFKTFVSLLSRHASYITTGIKYLQNTNWVYRDRICNIKPLPSLYKLPLSLQTKLWQLCHGSIPMSCFIPLVLFDSYFCKYLFHVEMSRESWHCSETALFYECGFTASVFKSSISSVAESTYLLNLLPTANEYMLYVDFLVI